jgi:hypothetical protein
MQQEGKEGSEYDYESMYEEWNKDERDAEEIAEETDGIDDNSVKLPS